MTHVLVFARKVSLAERPSTCTRTMNLVAEEYVNPREGPGRKDRKAPLAFPTSVESHPMHNPQGK